MKEQRSKRVEAPRESPLRKAASLCGRGCGRAGARLWGARGTAAASCLPDEALCLLASANSALSVGPQRGRLSYWTHGRVSRPRPARGRSRRCRARGCRRGTQPECAELAHRRRGREGGSLSPGLGCVSLAGDLPPFWMHCPLRWGGAAVAPVALGGIRARPALPPKQVWLQRSTLLTKPSTPLWRRVGGAARLGRGRMTGLAPHCSGGSPSPRPWGTAPEKRATPPQRVEQLRGRGQDWDVAPLGSHQPATPAREAPGNLLIQRQTIRCSPLFPSRYLALGEGSRDSGRKGMGAPGSAWQGRGRTEG